MRSPINPAPPSRSPPPADPPGVAARRAALRVLDAVLRRGEPLEGALGPATRRLDHDGDRGLVHALSAAVLRWMGPLDALIDGTTRQPLPPDAKARMALRLALVQVLVLGTPPHAAIATVLPLVEGGPRKLVHGVFGTLARAGAVLPAVATLPADVAARWQAAWGEQVVDAAAAQFGAQPPLDLTLADAADTGRWEQALNGTSLAPGHVRVADGAAVPTLPGYRDGAWWVQDIAASLPARLLGPGGGRALDLCAAPGGKTLQLAAAGWQLTAVDQSESRLARLSENLSRTGLQAAVVAADVLDWQPPAPVDAVLLDAPCSATGIFRRHPDVLYRAHPRAIAELAGTQARLLARAADWVRPGGTLVYATCSLEPEEGEEQVGRLMADRLDFALVPPRPDEVPAGVTIDPRGWLRVLPGTLAPEGGADGFFVARLRRAG